MQHTLLCWFTHSLGTLRGAISTEVEGVLFRRDSHDGGVNEAQLHDASVVPPQAGGVMQPDPRRVLTACVRMRTSGIIQAVTGGWR